MASLPAHCGDPISSTYKASDGYVGIHAHFPNHVTAALSTIGLPASCEDLSIISSEVKKWRAIDLETAANDNKAVVYALRSPTEWSVMPQAKSLPRFPITLRKICDAPAGLPSYMANPKAPASDKCLSGLRVAE